MSRVVKFYLLLAVCVAALAVYEQYAPQLRVVLQLDYNEWLTGVEQEFYAKKKLSEPFHFAAVKVRADTSRETLSWTLSSAGEGQEAGRVLRILRLIKQIKIFRRSQLDPLDAVADGVLITVEGQNRSFAARISKAAVADSSQLQLLLRLVQEFSDESRLAVAAVNSTDIDSAGVNRGRSAEKGALPLSSAVQIGPRQ